MEPERVARWVSLVNTVLWAALLAIWIRNALAQAPPAALLGVPLYPYPAQVEPVARYIVGALYAVFKWVLIAVVIISGIGAALGLVSEYVAFVGIRVPRATLRTLLSDVVQLILMKLVVDAALAYFGYASGGGSQPSGPGYPKGPRPQPTALDVALWGTWVGYATVALGALLGVWLVVRALKGKGVIEVG